MSKSPVGLLLLFGLCMLTRTSLAQTKTWSGVAGNNVWSTSTNWSPSGKPTATQDVLFDNSIEPTLPATITMDATSAVQNFTINTDNSFTVLSSGAAVVHFTFGGNLTQSGTGTQTFNFNNGPVGSYINLAAASGTSTWTVNGSGGGVVVNGEIQSTTGTNTLVKAGTGRLTISGTVGSTYTGGTVISAGTLLIDTTVNSGVGTGNVSLNGGMLGGGGNIGTSSKLVNILTTANGGIIAPGDGAATGILSVNGDVNFTSSGSTAFDVTLSGTTAGTGYDQLKLIGARQLTLDNTTLSLTLGFAPTAGQSFDIIDDGGTSAVSGTFLGLSQGQSLTALFSGTSYIFQVSYLGGTGNDVVLTATPEPKAVLLMGLGGLFLMLRFRAKKNDRAHAVI